MTPSFSTLITPRDETAWTQMLLVSLQGVSPVTQHGVQQPSMGNVVLLLGTGTVQAVGPATANANVVVEITLSGNVGTAQFSYSLDGGLTYLGPYPVPANVSPVVGTFLIPEINVTLVFANGLFTSPGAPNDSAGNPSSFIGPHIAGGSGDSALGETFSFVASVPNFPVSNWETGGVARTLVQADARALASLDATAAQVAAGGFANSWLNPPLINGVPTSPPDAWLDLLSQGFYNRSRGPGSQAQGYLLLQASSAAGPYQMHAGDLTAVSATGQLFVNLEAFTIPKGGQVSALFGAATGIGAAYNSCVSLNPVFLGVTTHGGLGTGTVTVAAGYPWTFLPVVKITRASTATVNGQFDYSLDGGTTFTGTPQDIPAGQTFTPQSAGAPAPFELQFTGGQTGVGVWNLGDTYTPGVGRQPGSNTISRLVTPLPGVSVGNYLQATPEVFSTSAAGALAFSGYPSAEITVLITVTAAGGVGAGQWIVSTGDNLGIGAVPSLIGTQLIAGLTIQPSGTFAVGDTFQFSTRWLQQLGADMQSSASLAADDQGQWGMLAPGAPADLYQVWAKAASREVVSATATPDPVVPGQINLVLQGPLQQPVSPAASAAVQAFIDARLPDGVSVVVTTVIPVLVSFTSQDGQPHIWVSAQSQQSVQSAIASALNALQEKTLPGSSLTMQQIYDSLPVQGAANGIPGLLAIDASLILVNGNVLNGSGAINLASNMVVSIQPPGPSLYGSYGT